ncbi:MAG: hypothetical protein I3J02_05175 [Prevotella sp.]|nr:hypothetical protein [Prevotella sp.]
MMTVGGLSACHHVTLEDRAEQEAREFTQRYCPTPVKDFQRTDSVTFDRQTHTFNYYYQLSGAADNPETIKKMRGKLRTALVNDLVGNTGSKTFKEQGYNFRYVFVSEKTKEILFEEELTKKDYQSAL